MLRIDKIAAVLLIAGMIFAVGYEHGRQAGYISGWTRGFDAADVRATENTTP